MSKPMVPVKGGVLNEASIPWQETLDSFSVETENKIYYYETVYASHDPERIELIEVETVE